MISKTMVCALVVLAAGLSNTASAYVTSPTGGCSDDEERPLMCLLVCPFGKPLTPDCRCVSPDRSAPKLIPAPTLPFPPGWTW